MGGLEGAPVVKVSDEESASVKDAPDLTIGGRSFFGGGCFSFGADEGVFDAENGACGAKEGALV